MSDHGQTPVWEPSANSRIVKALRFANLLDDAKNVVSPVKVNVWAANLTTICAGAATVLSWLGGHLGLVTELWGPIGGWLASAHATHHFDKRERNKQAVRMKDGSP